MRKFLTSTAIAAMVVAAPVAGGFVAFHAWAAGTDNSNMSNGNSNSMNGDVTISPNAGGAAGMNGKPGIESGAKPGTMQKNNMTKGGAAGVQGKPGSKSGPTQTSGSTMSSNSSMHGSMHSKMSSHTMITRNASNDKNMSEGSATGPCSSNNDGSNCIPQ